MNYPIFPLTLVVASRRISLCIAVSSKTVLFPAYQIKWRNLWLATKIGNVYFSVSVTDVLFFLSLSPGLWRNSFFLTVAWRVILRGIWIYRGNKKFLGFKTVNLVSKLIWEGTNFTLLVRSDQMCDETVSSLFFLLSGEWGDFVVTDRGWRSELPEKELDLLPASS